jgi:UPF0755 protein
MNRGLKILFAVAVVAALALSLSMRSYLASPVVTLTAPLVFELQSGASLNGVARDLQRLGLLERPRWFVAWGRFTGQAAQLKAGEYELLPGATPKGMLDQFVAGRVKLYPFIILEGWTIREVFTAIDSAKAVVSTMQDMSMQQQAIALGLQESHLEGQFYPETYMIPRGTTDVQLLKQAAALLQTELATAWKARSVGLPLKTPYELLILASIVERETALESERQEVAGVFIRRLQKNMRLQTDPTVIYGLGEDYDGNLTRKHMATDNPYNTYRRNGLPPTPIGMPSRASLMAAGHPNNGESLYFVATGDSDGSHVFSKTLEDHNAAVAVYIATLKQQRRQQRAQE